MPRFQYVAKSAPAKTIQGTIDAETEQEAIKKLTKSGYFPVSIQSESSFLDKHSVLGLRKVSKKELVIFTRQLSNLIESGVNLFNGLNIIAQQTSNKYLKSILADISAQIKEGNSLSESLKMYPGVFGDLYVSMVYSGEAGGTLDQSLKKLSEFLEKEQAFRDSVRAALIYPAFIFSASLLTIIVLLGFVIPRFVGMFEDMGQVLPVPTKILISVSLFMRGYWWLIIAGLGAFVFVFRRIQGTTQGKLAIDAFLLKLPLFGQFTLKTELSRLLRTLSLLLSSGLPMLKALEICSASLSNAILKTEMVKLKEQVSSGSSITAYLAVSPIFPQYVTNIVAIGEETGTLERSFLRIADEYEKDVDAATKVMTRMIEPIIILVMGLFVGFIVLAMLLPIFQINLLVR